MKYSYIKDKTIWFKKTTGVTWKEDGLLPINKKNPTQQDIDATTEQTRPHNDPEISTDQSSKIPKLVIYDKTIKKDSNGKLFILKNDERLYINDFVSKKLIDKYKDIKNRTKKYRHKKLNSRMFLVSSFDKDFTFTVPKENVAGFVSIVKKIIGCINYRAIFTYNTWKLYGYPALADSVIITNTTEEFNTTYKRLPPSQRNNTMVFRSDIYSMTDGRCNLDLVVDLLKLWTNTNKTIVAFLEPVDINNTFYFFNNIFILRNPDSHKISVGDAVNVVVVENKKPIVSTKYVTNIQRATLADKQAAKVHEYVYTMDDDTIAHEHNISQIKFPIDKFINIFQDVCTLLPEWESSNFMQIFKKTYS